MLMQKEVDFLLLFCSSARKGEWLVADRDYVPSVQQRPCPRPAFCSRPPPQRAVNPSTRLRRWWLREEELNGAKWEDTPTSSTYAAMRWHLPFSTPLWFRSMTSWQQILVMEKSIRNRMSWNLIVPTPAVFPSSMPPPWFR